MFKKYFKLIGITCLDFFTVVFCGFFLIAFTSEFIIEVKDELKIINRPTQTTPLDSFIWIMFMLIFVALVVYLNITEYKKSKIQK